MWLVCLQHVREELLDLERREVDLPGDLGLGRVEQVEDALLLPPARRRQVVADVPERRAREHVHAVRERLRQRRREVVVGDRELVREAVVEGQHALVVVAHRAAAGRVGGIDVRGREAVHRAAVPLLVRSVPRVVEVRDGALLRDLERRDGVHRVRRVGVARGGLDDRRGLALVVQAAEVRVVRPVLLHHHDDVLDLGQAGGRRRLRVVGNPSATDTEIALTPATTIATERRTIDTRIRSPRQ